MRIRLWAFAALALFTLPGGAGAAPKFKTLYSFCAQSSCADGGGPRAALLRDADGNLYGTTLGGGDNGSGTVFELALQHGTYQFHRLYSFCAEAGCADGEQPQSALIQDTAGRLYGTTGRGGTTLDGGTVFMLKPNKHRTKWSLVTLYSFCPDQFSCTTGQHPHSGLTYKGALSGTPYDGVSPLYGTTENGGGSGSGNAGVAYQLTSRGKTRRIFDVIYNFCSQNDCDDGQFPGGALIVDPQGTLDGVTVDGGARAGMGLVFQLSVQHNNATQRTLYEFCQLKDCGDGALPIGSVTLDGNARFFGTTQQGGDQSSNGALFLLTPQGINYKETLLYTFCAKANCSDGSLPNGSLALDASGDLIGTGLGGGDHNGGVIFKMHDTAEQVLYSFCSQDGCADGDQPASGAIIDPVGNIFGTTSSGGAHGVGGTVYELTP